MHSAIFASTGAIAVSPGEGGGGGSSLTFAYNNGKSLQASGTTLVITPAVKPSTNSLIVVGAVIGLSTFTSVVDNRGNVFMQNNFDSRVTVGVALWHFVATATYNGAYTITITVPGTTSILGGVVIASNTNTSASVDVTTKSFLTTTNVVHTGTTPVTNAKTGICVAAFVDNDGTNHAITPRSPWTQVAEEQDGTSYQTGAIAYSTTSVSNAVVTGNWTEQNLVTYGAVMTCFKDP